MPKYSRHIFWSDEDGGFIATCPEFPNLSGFGESEQEALSELGVALELAIETYQEEGWSLPEPEKVPSFSGQFRLRVPKTMHAQLSRRAEGEGVSLNTLVVTYLGQALGREQERGRIQETLEHHKRVILWSRWNALSFQLHERSTSRLSIEPGFPARGKTTIEVVTREAQEEPIIASLPKNIRYSTSGTDDNWGMWKHQS